MATKNTALPYPLTPRELQYLTSDSAHKAVHVRVGKRTLALLNPLFGVTINQLLQFKIIFNFYCLAHLLSTIKTEKTSGKQTTLM